MKVGAHWHAGLKELAAVKDLWSKRHKLTHPLTLYDTEVSKAVCGPTVCPGSSSTVLYR
jgi:hypothetical protein